MFGCSLSVPRLGIVERKFLEPGESVNRFGVPIYLRKVLGICGMICYPRLVAFTGVSYVEVSGFSHNAFFVIHKCFCLTFFMAATVFALKTGSAQRARIFARCSGVAHLFF